MRASHNPEFRAALLLPRYWLTWLLFAVCALLAALPIPLRAALARLFAAIAWRLPSRRRHIARVNLRLCFPELPAAELERLLRRHAEIVIHVFLHYGQLMFGATRALEDLVDVCGREHFDAAVADGSNVILLTPHAAALEHVGQWIALQHPLVSVVRLHEGDEALDWIVSRMRNRFGAHFVGHRDGMLPLIKAVRSGDWLYYLPDEDQGGDNAAFAPFYGVPKSTIATLGRLADSCRAVVLPFAGGYCIERRRFWIRFLPARAFHASGDAAADARRTNELLEEIIDVDRAQYMWSQKIFRTRPPGIDKPY
ncbi:MAG: hypothetical protein R3E86_11400 [Pseudomonadales bacterium]